MSAALDDLAVIDEQDLVRGADRRQPMGDDDDEPIDLESSGDVKC